MDPAFRTDFCDIFYDSCLICWRSLYFAARLIQHFTGWTFCSLNRGNMVAKALFAQIDLAQTVEEQQAGLYCGVLEFAEDKIPRGELAYFE